MRAAFRPVDLAALTETIAGSFREVTARGGVELLVDCPPLSTPAHVDLDLWEHIVLNLLPNAFKFTLHGTIEVRLSEADGQAELLVADSGCGIPAHEIGRLFERFHVRRPHAVAATRAPGSAWRSSRSSPSCTVVRCRYGAGPAARAGHRGRRRCGNAPPRRG